MFPGKSPNNAFNLHKVRMADVFQSIIQSSPWRIRLIRHMTRMTLLERLDTNNSLNFCWVTLSNTKYLFYKGYINSHGHWDNDIPCIESQLTIMKVREYYTDGVRSIGAME